MKLSIVIPVWNNANFTKACLEDLIRLPYEIIVVNNGSTDHTESIIPPQVKHIKLNENTGFAHACNVGYKESSGENVMFLNNDIRVKANYSDWVDPIIAEAESGSIVGPTIGVLAPGLSFMEERDSWVDRGYCYMSGWNITASKVTWEKLKIGDGPFIEDFGKAYFEDTDLSLRAIELGIPFKIMSVPVVHFGKMTSQNMNVGFYYGIARTKFLEVWKDRIKNLPEQIRK